MTTLNIKLFKKEKKKKNTSRGFQTNLHHLQNTQYIF